MVNLQPFKTMKYNLHSKVFLDAYKDLLFKIEEDFQVGINANDFDVIGCCCDYTLGSLYTDLDSKLSIKNKVLRALKPESFLRSNC